MVPFVWLRRYRATWCSSLMLNTIFDTTGLAYMWDEMCSKLPLYGQRTTWLFGCSGVALITYSPSIGHLGQVMYMIVLAAEVNG